MLLFSSRVAFVGVALLLVYGMHRYVWARLVRDVGLSRRWKIAATAVLVALALSLAPAYFIGRSTLADGSANFTLEAFMWLGVLFYCVLLLGAIDVLRAALFVSKRVRKLAGPADVRGPAAPSRSESSTAAAAQSTPVPPALPAPPADSPLVPERRVFLARAIAGSVALGSGGIAIGGYRSAMGDITTPEIPVRLERLPRELSGYRIVQLSDLHLGPTLAQRFLESVVEKTNAEKPDLVVITGDMVDGRVATIGAALAPLSKLSARHGIVFVTGNHEYYSGADEWVEFLRQRGIHVLINERMELGDGGIAIASDGDSRGARRPSFDLVGLPDSHGGGHSAAHAPDLARALAGRDPERELVLLAHQPSQIAMAEGRGVGLQLSGHTHGGQMWPFGSLVGLVQPYIAGHHVHRDGTQIYVSRGTGFWGPPMRIASPAEIASIVLVSS